VIALVAASWPEIVRTMVEADFLETWASVVSNQGRWGRWIAGLKSGTSDYYYYGYYRSLRLRSPKTIKR